MRRLERLYAEVEEIRRRAPAPVSATQLAERFGVSRRTVERDLAALQSAGVPLYAWTGRAGGYAIDRTSDRVALTLTAAEATALLLAAVTAGAMPFADSASSAARRLLDALPEPTRVQIDELRNRIRTTLSDAPTPDPRVKAVVEEAVRTSGVVRLEYVDRNGARTRRARRGGRLPRRRRRLVPRRLVPPAPRGPGVPPRSDPPGHADGRAGRAPRRRRGPGLGPRRGHHPRVSPRPAAMPAGPRPSPPPGGGQPHPEDTGTLRGRGDHACVP